MCVQVASDGGLTNGNYYSGWDSLKIYGCFCDHYFYKGDYRQSYADYAGHDCALQTCPYGQ